MCTHYIHVKVKKKNSSAEYLQHWSLDTPVQCLLKLQMSFCMSAGKYLQHRWLQVACLLLTSAGEHSQHWWLNTPVRCLFKRQCGHCELAAAAWGAGQPSFDLVLSSPRGRPLQYVLTDCLTGCLNDWLIDWLICWLNMMGCLNGSLGWLIEWWLITSLIHSFSHWFHVCDKMQLLSLVTHLMAACLIILIPW